jgi:hypothetical protein
MPAVPPLDRLPARHEVLKYLWRLDHHDVDRLRDGDAPGPVLDDHARFFGPKTKEMGEQRFARLIDAYESMRTHGYDPGRFGGRNALGYFLVRADGDFRFVAGAVNHRLPALHRLGIRRIVANFLPHHPPVVEEAHLERWCVERGGIYPLESAGRLFDQMFTATGIERARAFGLVHRTDGA